MEQYIKQVDQEWEEIFVQIKLLLNQIMDKNLAMMVFEYCKPIPFLGQLCYGYVDPDLIHRTLGGSETGLWIRCYNNGSLWIKEYLLNGQHHGPMTSYYKDGTISTQRTYIWGLAHGAHFSAFGDGGYCKSHYINGKLDGLYTLYYPNGTKEMECNYVDNQIHGKRILWKNGQIITEEIYEHGQRLQIRSKDYAYC